ncbi:MAG TPA: PilZ domain-containing protein [Candidatus Polarisedimenticolaceae bacterium]
MSKQHAERRSHARFQRSFDIEGQDGATIARMTASDLSLGGLYCSSTHDFPEMTRLAVRMLLPNGAGPEPVDAEAVVVRRKKLKSPTGNGPRFELALFFTHVDDAGRERLARFLAAGAH